MRKNTSIKLLLKTQIIEKYVKTITDFLLLFGQSSLIDESSNIIYTGITTIHRVFEYVLSKTHSLEKTLYYAQKASYYYLEYGWEVSSIYCFIINPNIVAGFTALNSMIFATPLIQLALG